MPFVAFLVFPMDPTNVFKHCHKPICHFWQHSGVKKGGRQPKRYGHWPWCTVIGGCRCLLLPSLCFQWTLPMFSNTATSPFAIFGNTQESKKGAGNPRGMAIGHGVL